MSVEDNNITAAARRVLASYWADLTQLNIRTVAGIIYISGCMRRMTFEHAEMDERILSQLDADLRAIEGVRETVYDLDNWVVDDRAMWKRVAPSHRKERPPEDF